MKNSPELQIVYVDINDLVDAHYNPRKATEKDFEDIKESIRHFGFVDPVIVNSNADRFNIIIGGHFRVRAGKSLKVNKVPVVYIDIADIEKEKELNIRLNKNTGSFDYDVLANHFEVADLKEYGFTDRDFGFDIDEPEEKPKKEKAKKDDTDGCGCTHIGCCTS